MCEGKTLDFNLLKNLANDVHSKLKIEEIEKDHYEVFGEGKIPAGKNIFSVILDNMIIYFRKNSAYSSIDVYHEIFIKNKHLKLKEFIEVGDGIVIDVGAGEGFYTLKIKRCNPQCKVIAIEPNYSSFELLEKNVNANKLNDVVLVRKAVYSTTGDLNLQFVEEIPAITGISIDKPWLDKNRIKTFVVEMITLNQLFYDYKVKKVDLLKIDTEGCEVEILKGGIGVLNKINKIVIEYHSDTLKQEVIKLLTESGFKHIFEDRDFYGDLYFTRL